MNKEILKAIENKQKKHPFRDWWSKNGYKVMRILLFPIWIYSLINDWNYTRTTWDEKRADKILNYYIPQRSEWNPKEKHFWFFDNGMGWDSTKCLKIKDRVFWRKFKWEIRKYLINKFELEGFEKEIIDTYDWYVTEVIFTQK